MDYFDYLFYFYSQNNLCRLRLHPLQFLDDVMQLIHLYLAFRLLYRYFHHVFYQKQLDNYHQCIIRQQLRLQQWLLLFHLCF